MLSMKIEYGEMVISIFPRVFASWEYDSDYSGYINSKCSIIVTCMDASDGAIIGGGNDIDGITYNTDTMGKHYLPVVRALAGAIKTLYPERAVLSYCMNTLTKHEHLFNSISFIN